MISFRRRAYSSSNFSAHSSDVFWVTGNKRSRTGEVRVDIDADGKLRIYILTIATENLLAHDAVSLVDTGNDNEYGVEQSGLAGAAIVGVSPVAEAVLSGEYFWVQVIGQAVVRSLGALIGNGQRCRSATGLVIGESGAASGQSLVGFSVSDGDVPAASQAYCHLVPGIGVVK